MSHDPAMDELLRQTPLLRPLDKRLQDDLLQRIETRRFKEGEVLLEAGTPGNTMMVLLKGELDVYARETEKRFRVARMVPGALVGEIAFFSPKAPRTADVVGRQPGAVAVIPFEVYATLCQSNPAAAASLEKAVLGVLADRLEETNRTMASLMDRYRSSGLPAALQWLVRLFGAKG